MVGYIPYPNFKVTVTGKQPGLGVIVKGLARVSPYSQKTEMPALTPCIQDNYEQIKNSTQNRIGHYKLSGISFFSIV